MIKVYTKNDMVEFIELNLEVGEFFVIRNALVRLASDLDSPVEDRLLAVMLTENFKEKEKVEMDDFN